MKPIIRSILISFTVLLFILSPAPCRAEDPVTHNFHTLATTSGMKLNPPSNTIGVTDFVTYTCSDSKAKFSLDFFNIEGKQKIAINLEENGNYVTTSVINNLQRVEINCTSQKAKTNVKVYISTDGLKWDAPDNIEYGLLIIATFPAGDYYVKILNNADDNKVSVYQIDYYFLDPLSGCPNCFIYRPE